jgi:hypothetical protein
MLTIALPAGEVISNDSVAETRETPSKLNSSIVEIRSDRFRPQRSTFQTTTTSIFRRRAASIIVSRSGRVALPEAISETTMVTDQLRCRARLFTAFICIGRVFCSLVETLAYSAARMIYIFQVSKNFLRKTITESPEV